MRQTLGSSFGRTEAVKEEGKDLHATRKANSSDSAAPGELLLAAILSLVG